jgi:DNA ligase 1
MNSKQVLQALNEIADTPSKNDKIALVTKYIVEDEFKSACKLAYDPFCIYGIIPTKEDELLEPGELRFDENDTYLFLQDLMDRKLTGNAARFALEKQLKTLDKDSAELLVRIIRKDLRAGFSESTINKACKDLIPVFPYQRCSLPKDAKLEEWKWESGVISQEKADGMFANANRIKGTLFFSSRQGTPFPMAMFEDLVEEAKIYLREDFQYHGELLVERDGKILPREIGNGILNSVIKGGSFDEGDRAIYEIWDMIPITSVKSKGQYDVPYLNRLKDIQKSVKECTLIRMIETKVVKSLEQAYKHFFAMLQEGKEGTVIKKPTMIWKDGTSKDQVKMKLEADCELEIVQINPGKVGSKNEGRAGALHCTSSCGGLIVDVAVKNEKMRDEIDKAPNDWIGRIVTVRSNQLLNPSASNDNHSLFLPRLVEDTYRLDKSEADSLERITAQFDSAIKGKVA